MHRDAAWMVWMGTGLLLAVGPGCGGKSDGGSSCPEGIIAIVGAAEWSTLEGAMGTITPGSDVDVELCPGTFSSRTFVEEPGGGWGRIILRGHPDGTILDGGGDGTVLNLVGDGIIELRDLTLANGYAEVGGGGYRGRGNQLLILENVRFKGNEASADGGGVRLLAEEGGSVAIEDGGGSSVVFEDNHCGGNGGAVSVNGEGFASFSPGGWTFTGNSAGGNGGAVALEGSEVVGMFGDFVAEDNQAGGDGGALFVQAPTASGLTLGRVDATNNRAGPNGGVIRLAGSSTGDFTLASGAFSTNSASEGGAIAATNGWSLNVAGTTFADNSPDDVRYAGDSYRASELGSSFTCQPDEGCSPAR
jgi:predicted outer membrane repeat protein